VRVTKPQQMRKICPACAAQQRKKIGCKDRWTIYLCRRCQSLFAEDGSMTPPEHNYNEYYNENNLVVPDFINGILDGIVSRFAPYRKTNRLLDIGCGAGSLLLAARRANWDAKGLEVSRPAAEHVRKLGFDVFLGEISEAEYPDETFDVVTASEILEHVADASALLREIARILRPGGLLWATTPHARGASARLLGTRWSVITPPEHYHVFSRMGIRQLLLRAGFSKPRILTQGFNPYEIVSAFRNRGDTAFVNIVGTGGNARVISSYELNSRMSHAASTKLLKGAANGILNLTSMGDSLKIWAEK
jgi:SAM-dependent methyltransferase